MQIDSTHFPATPIALKMGVAVGIGMLVGMEREWSNKDVGVRSFAIVALLGMLASVISNSIAIASLVGVLLLIAAMNTRSILSDHSLEITTSAALLVNYLLGVLVGLGHIFTPVAGAIVMTMLLAWKTELSRFAGGLLPSEIRSAVLLGLIGFVIYPVLPKRYIDPWQLFNPSDAWISVIAIAGIGFVNYVFLRIYSTRGLYLSALFGGLVNSSATVAELAGRAVETGMIARTTTLCLLTTIAMFARNLILATLFSPKSLSATLVPLLVMTLVAGLWMWRDRVIEQTVPGTLKLASRFRKCCGSGRCLSQFKLAELSSPDALAVTVCSRLEYSEDSSAVQAQRPRLPRWPCTEISVQPWRAARPCLLLCRAPRSIC